jgi:hopanoid-associated phosphorylase
MIAVVTGLRAEARCLRGVELTIACSGARPGRARAEAARLLAQGADGLVSFGLAAGLAPELRPGDLIVADAVALEDGRRLATDEAWRNGLLDALAMAGIAAWIGAVAGVDRVLATLEQKQALLAATGALAADMESGAVAAAAAAGKPALVIRAISDAADQTLPAGAAAFVGRNGEIQPAALLPLLAEPRALAALLRLGLSSGRALRRLRQVARGAGRSLERPPMRSSIESEPR